ncbi:sugar O-acetyltransferase [Staphylococcus saccharolyticus]|uniref:sugar O-acetyltransferase n=1 Tax=Staphylococcus saccharolyticus TaxID=33028 RepID=UPI0032DFD734
MTEKEKMLAHEWFDANFDEELKSNRLKAKDLCFAYNYTRPSEKATRQKILTELFGYQITNVSISIPLDTDYGWNVKFGKNVSLNTNCYLMDGGGIQFGDDVFVGPNCGFYTATHPLDYETRNKGLELAEPIVVGSNTCFGGHVSVFSGVTIVEGSVIGAGGVVTKDIPPNSLAVGNSCKVIRQLNKE